MSQLIVIGLEKPRKVKKLQPGNCEWVTLVQGIRATGKCILLFIIFAGKVLILTQFKLGILHNQIIQVSLNSQISNNLALTQLKYFNMHVKPIGVYRMLIINSYKSYYLVDFQDYYKEKKIITLYIPPYLLHLLQPLDITYFLLLKHYYSNSILALARNYIYYISKETFLPTFKATYEQTFTKDNTHTGF